MAAVMGRSKSEDLAGLGGTPGVGTGGGGGGYSSAGHMYPPGATLRDLTWDTKVKSLKEFVATYRLPLVARVRSGDLSKFLPPCGPHQDNAVQIHEVRRRKIVLARRLQWEKRQNDYIVSGEQVEVPASFKGWFEVVPDDGRPVEYFDTVGGICSIKPRRFLVRTSTVGYQLSIEDGVSCWMPYEIRPGEVLTTGMVYMDNNNNNNNSGSGKKGKGGSSSSATSNNNNNNNNNSGSSKGFFKRLLKSSKNKNKPEQDLKYLQCFDSEGKEIMIPLIMSGVFSPVGDASMANYDAVYELQDLIMAFGLPVNAQLIHANLKEKATCPQGVLRLYGTREEELAVLSRVERDAFIADPAVEKVEVLVDKELALQRAVPRRRHSVQTNRPAPISNSADSEARVVQIDEPGDEEVGGGRGSVGSGGSGGGGSRRGEVELPKRVPTKELKKSKSTGLLDKLSVRKVRKERARLKELRADDVFSRRIIRNELSYEDFFNGLDGEEGEGEEGARDATGNSKDSGDGGVAVQSPQSPGAGQGGSASVYGQLGASKSVYGTYGKSAGKGKGGGGGGKDRTYNIQDRDLPPIPVDSPGSSSGGRQDSSQGSKDSLYEHLPPAPKPPPALRSHSEPARGVRDDEDEDDDDLDDAEDGYMVPMSVRGMDSAYSSSVDVQLRKKPPAAPRTGLKLSRLKKCYSDLLPPEMQTVTVAASDENLVTDIDKLFGFVGNKDHPERPYGTMATAHWTGSTSQLYGMRTKDRRGSEGVPAWRAEVHRQQSISQPGRGVPGEERGDGGGTLTRRSVERLNLETRNVHSARGPRSRDPRMDANATIRSHNLRPSKASLMELFHFSESFGDLRDRQQLGENGLHMVGTPSPDSPSHLLPGEGSASSPESAYPPRQSAFTPPQRTSRAGGDQTGRGAGDNPYGAVISPSFLPGGGGGGGGGGSSSKGTGGVYFPRPQHYVPYADSEPVFRKSYPKAVSLSGHSDSAYPKQGDDSAISMGSRGENPYGFNNDSEYSYNEYTDNGSGSTVTGREDNWLPPDDISGLSVHEVSRSLRYIGMKDRVVLRFSNEQIDGNMLCSLDKRLLKEGFPELNALEIKKILDFVRGWRPKKR